MILFEDEHIYVVHKPHEISFSDFSKSIPYSPAHRLDKVTSGVFLFTKSKEAAREIESLFSQKKILKTYIAIAGNKPKKKQGTISGNMERSRRSTWKLTRNGDNQAVTKFQSFTYNDKDRIYLLNPLTGKTHQIRVALKSLSVPIHGDKLYGGIESDRCYLHCYKMSFSLFNRLYEVESNNFEGLLFDNKFRKKLEEIINSKL